MISRNRSPGGPPPGPTSPSPASWMWVPSSTPAGILTLTVRRVLTRPSPSHSGHGLRMTVPNPPQLGHARDVITWPRNDLVTWLISPRPLQTSQVVGWLPGALPSPEQVGQTTAVSTVSSLVAPNTHSARSRSTRMVALRPRRARLRGPRAAWPPPKKASMMSLNGNPAPKPAAPPAGANGSPPRAYSCRFSGAETTSYPCVSCSNPPLGTRPGLTYGL